MGEANAWRKVGSNDRYNVWLGDGSSIRTAMTIGYIGYSPYPVVQLDKENSRCKEGGEMENEGPNRKSWN